VSSDLERRFEFYLKANRIAGYERELKFSSDRKWRFDYAWPHLGVAVELEGGTWIGGAHTRGPRFESDCQKYNRATIEGWSVLRFTTNMVRHGEAVITLKELLVARQAAMDANIKEGV
jgi:very-short-patch-repair endonuclease